MPLENSSHFTDSYGNLNDLNGTIHHGIEFSFDDPPEEPIESDLGSAEDDHLGKFTFKFVLMGHKLWHLSGRVTKFTRII